MRWEQCQRLLQTSVLPTPTDRPHSTNHAKVPAEKDGVGVVLLGIVESDALFPMPTGSGKLSQAKPDCP